MKNIHLLLAILLLSSQLSAQSTAVPGSATQSTALPGPVSSTSSGPADSVRTLLPNGWSLTPAGQSIPLSSDLPLNMAFSPDGTHLAVTNNGNGRQTIDLINLKQQRLVAAITIKKAWLGLAFAGQHPYLYASGGNDDIIIRYQLIHDTL